MIRESGEKEWNFAAYRYNKETSSTERTNLLNGMSCTRLTWLVDRLLNNLINSSIFNQADSISGFRSVAIRPDGISKTWNFLKGNWDEMFRK